MNTIDAIKARYSCRAFSDRMPSDADLKIITEAAVATPSAMNMQPWQVIVLKNKQLLNELEAEALKNIASLEDKSTYERVMSRGGKVFYDTPCQIFIPVPSLEVNKWAGIDCGIITQNIALAATSLGINSLICGMINFAFMGDKGGYFKKQLGFPEGYDVGLSILLGYADDAGIKPPHEPDLSKISIIE